MYTCGHLHMDDQRSARTYIQQLCADAECSLKDLSGAMDDKRCVVRDGQGDPC